MGGVWERPSNFWAAAGRAAENIDTTKTIGFVMDGSLCLVQQPELSPGRETAATIGSGARGFRGFVIVTLSHAPANSLLSKRM
jgi:hypothetical protein